MSAIIEVNKIRKSKCIQWKIIEFFQSANDVILYISESNILLFEKQWFLVVYPRGVEGDKPQFITISFVLQEPDSKVSVNLMIDEKHVVEAIRSGTEEENKAAVRYRIWTWVYLSSELMMQFNNGELRGRVIISCKDENSNRSSFADTACQTTFLSNTVNASGDFQDLFLSGKKSDASIEVQGQLFRVHKLILEVCSPVLSAMFDHDMSEKNINIVKIDDCDPNIFQKFLKCLYSGKLENISPDDLLGLYKVSDKYAVSDLKKKCSEFMMKELSESTVLGVLDIAEMCNDVQLKTSAEEFLIKNIKMILRTKRWKKFHSESPSLAAEILSKAVENCISQ